MKIYCPTDQLRPLSPKSEWRGRVDASEVLAAVQWADLVVFPASFTTVVMSALPVIGIAAALQKPVLFLREYYQWRKDHDKGCLWFGNSEQPIDSEGCECGKAKRKEDRYLDEIYGIAAALPNVLPLAGPHIEGAQGCIEQIDKLESPIECQLFMALLREGVASDCISQYSIGKYRLDFAYPHLKLAIECDGHDYHASKEQRGHDAERDRFLLTEGWRTARFTGSQIFRDAQACAAEVATLLSSVAPAATSHIPSPIILPVASSSNPQDSLRSRMAHKKYTEDVWRVISALEGRKQTHVLVALLVASSVRLYRGCRQLQVDFKSEDVWTARLRASGLLFREVGREVFGAPLDLDVQIISEAVISR